MWPPPQGGISPGRPCLPARVCHCARLYRYALRHCENVDAALLCAQDKPPLPPPDGLTGAGALPTPSSWHTFSALRSVALSLPAIQVQSMHEIGA